MACQHAHTEHFKLRHLFKLTCRGMGTLGCGTAARGSWLLTSHSHSYCCAPGSIAACCCLNIARIRSLLGGPGSGRAARRGSSQLSIGLRAPALQVQSGSVAAVCSMSQHD